MPVTPPAEQLVLDYLRRVADAAHRMLGSDERLLFMARVRATIERSRREAGAEKPSEVAVVLNSFGDPYALVEQEQRRLAEASPGRPPASSAAGAEERDSLPRVRRRFGRTGRGGRPAAPRPPIAARKPRPVLQEADEPGRPPASTLGPLTAIRTFPREVIALLLLGVGGLIYPFYPFPLWPLGALIALTSRAWNHRDKWIGVGGPLAFTIVGVMVLGQLSLSHGFSAYILAARQGAGYLIRFGAVAGAAYLAWRIRRGERAPKSPPWVRRQRLLSAGPRSTRPCQALDWTTMTSLLVSRGYADAVRAAGPIAWCRALSILAVSFYSREVIARAYRQGQVVRRRQGVRLSHP
jgi:hypothetical protein